MPSRRDFLAHSPTTPIVRYLQQATAIKPLAVTLPLKLLVITANPSDFARLNVNTELNELEEALAELEQRGELRITWLEHATIKKLADILKKDSFHLLHFVGHSYFDVKNGEGSLVLEDEKGRGDYYEAMRLRALLQNHRTLRLVVLNSCEGAMHDANDAFSSMAGTLMLAGIPAVIAMQFEISDQAAISFATVFYAGLAKGMSIDEAVGEARLYLFAVEKNNVEWRTPVLYLRAKDGVLFSVQEQEKDLPGFKNLEGLATLEKLRTEEEIARKKALAENLHREELARQQKLQREKFIQATLEKAKKWGKYLLLTAAIVVIGYAVMVYGLSAYQDYKERQVLEAKQLAESQAKAEATRKAAQDKQEAARKEAEAQQAALKAKQEADAKAKADAEKAKQEALLKAQAAQAALEAKKKQAAENLRLEAKQWVEQGKEYVRQKNYKRACALFKQAADAGNSDGKVYFDQNKEVQK